jgi:hypothetical protein
MDAQGVARAAQKAEWSRANREKINERQRLWRASNPEKSRLAQRRYRVAQYGLTLEEFDALVAKQKGCCAICRKPLEKNTLLVHIDHDHETEEVRGVLCKPCNNGLGNFYDNVKVLKRAIEYLKRR